MNKRELVEAIASGSGVTKAEASRVLEQFIDVITAALKEGRRIALPGFGSFSIGERAERVGRNPRTGNVIRIKAARVPRFKAGKTLRDAVQGA